MPISSLLMVVVCPLHEINFIKWFSTVRPLITG